MSNLKAYLAEKYMSGPKAEAILSKTAPLKKKKRKAKDVTETQAGGTLIRDEDGGWGEISKEEENDDIADAVVAADRGFKKRKLANAAAVESSWITVQEGVGGMQVKEESPEPDEKPVIVDTPFVGGLVRPDQLKKILPQNNASTGPTLTAEEIARAQETVYRDSSGKKIDTKAARAEAARLKRIQEEKEAQKMEWGKGLVQKEEAEKRRKELEKSKTSAFARRADDTELNDELKSKELWNDPAAAFLTKKKSKGPRRPEYVGPPPPPNRFSIKPGYRWDGVDRGTGFEKKFFESKNAKKRLVTESYQWSVDDM